jgi:hypothetical protein
MKTDEYENIGMGNLRTLSTEKAGGAYERPEILPISVELLRRSRTSWMQGFEFRLDHGNVDHDYTFWTTGILKDDATVIDSTSGHVLVTDNEIQGIIVFDHHLKLSRIAPHAQALHVLYLATAPWNRAARDPSSPRVRGVGRTLVKQAVRESIRRGTPGRVSVYSLVKSAPFFERLRFANLGQDGESPGLIYLELPARAAFSLL